jgi:hypothetical protein
MTHQNFLAKRRKQPCFLGQKRRFEKPVHGVRVVNQHTS